MKARILLIVVCLLSILTGCSQSQSVRKNMELSSIQVIKENINSDISALKNSLNGNIFLADNITVNFPDCEKVCEMKLVINNNDDVNSHIKIVKDALKKWYPSGLKDDFIKDNLRIESDLGLSLGDSSKPIPYCYALLSDFPDIQNVDSLFITTKDFYVMTCSNNIYQMSRGEISHILRGENELADNLYNIQKMGEFHKKDNETFVLKDAEYTYQQAEKYAKDFLTNQIQFNDNSRMGIDVPQINTFKLDDENYALRVVCRRTFDNIPLDYTTSGKFRTTMSNEKEYRDELMYIDMISPDNFDFFVGEQILDVTILGEETDKIIPLNNVFDIISNTFTDGVDIEVKEIEFIYTLCKLDEASSIGRPTWKIKATNKTDLNTLNIYVDALNGEIWHNNEK